MASEFKQGEKGKADKKILILSGGIYDLAGATHLRDALRDFKGGRVAVVISSMPFKCPAAPFETALLLDDHLK